MTATSDWEITPYTSADRKEWNRFAAGSPCATFLFDRGYMDYHADRFADASLMVRHGGKTVALLPANRAGDTLFSHQGLTYGGWILPERHLDAAAFMSLWQEWLAFEKRGGTAEIIYKPLPHIYHRIPSEADLYMLFRSGATLIESAVSSTLRPDSFPGFNKLMKRQLKKALQSGLRVAETTDTAAFSVMLAECLRQRHSAVPVHSAAELELLRSRFPDRIRIFAVEAEGAMQAGVCVYDTGIAAHAQYIASTPLGRELHLLPLIFHHLISAEYASRRYFDFGISCEDGGRYLNEGLLRQKTAFGGTPTVYTRWRLTL